MNFSFSDLVDSAKLQTLMKFFYSATGIPVGIIDIDGNIIFSVGWQEICQNHHRKSPCTKLLRRENDQIIRDEMDSTTDSYKWHKCANGLVGAAAPIIISGEHIATVHMGQFLFDAVDLECFQKQPGKHSCSECEYLQAVARVPVCSKDRSNALMTYFIQFVGMIAEMGLHRLKQIELQAELFKKNDQEILKAFNSPPNIAIQSYDLDGNIMFWNAASEKIYGFSSGEALGKHVSKIFDEDTASKIIEIIKQISITEKPWGAEEWSLSNRNGKQVTFYSTFFPVRFHKGIEVMCTDVDITEKKIFEKELFRLDRLNLVGQMAASIGHEVRNPMTTVRGYLQILQSKPEFKGYTAHLDIMIEELDRANGIIREFLSLAQNKLVYKKMNNINQIVKSIMPLISADAIKNDITVSVLLGEVPDLQLDEKEIRQLILNLVRNGFEAISSNGKLSIKTFKADNEVVLEVKDNGSGISEEVLVNIGTPFFTTKPQGTGLGLSVCYSIAQRHHARIVIDSDSTGTVVSTRFLIH